MGTPAPDFYNRFAKSDYQVIDSFEVGIMLTGSETKSIRSGKLNLKGSYAKIIDGELWLLATHIAPYQDDETDPYRARKLLAHKQELIKINSKLKEKGLLLIPLRAYFKKGKLKFEIALARGKKKFDKRADIKKKDLERSTQRRIK